MQRFLLRISDVSVSRLSSFTSPIAVIFLLLAACTPLLCQALDFTQTKVLGPENPDRVEENSIRVLLEEESRRTHESWKYIRGNRNSQPSANGTIIIAARKDQLEATLPATFRRLWFQSIATDRNTPAEGFTVRTLVHGKSTALVIAGNDDRGLLFGVGYLLRKMELSSHRAILPRPLDLSTAPQFPIRGHQIGYRFKNNTYDAWTLPMFEQHIRELALFGSNAIQLIVPHSDDAPTSPLFPAPPMETLIGLSRILDEYGLDCDIFYPELRKNYGDPAEVDSELKDFDDLFHQLPRVDAVYVPGGDPGHTDPKVLFSLLEKEAAVLHKYHPHATLWVSAQGFDKNRYEDFYTLLQQHPRWLTGVFFGPQSRDSMETQRARIPQEYPIVFYPDIGHTMHAQFPVPHWDPAFAMTEGREPIDPRPLDETTIFRHFAQLNTGFITYSEGVNDDVNKFLWTQLGWNSMASPQETLADYSRFFLGPHIGTKSSRAFAEGLFALEQNWIGAIEENKSIDPTLQLFTILERQASSKQKTNWRFESALYRAYYDAFLRKRLLDQTAQEASAMEALEYARTKGSQAAIQAASRRLQPALTPQEAALREHIFSLADSLFQHCRIQLSVKKYGASGIERGANLDRIDATLNDRPWLMKQFAEIEKLSTEEARLKQIHLLTHWTNPLPGSFYDDLGNPGHEPHLALGHGFVADPELYKSAIDGIADRTPEDGWRVSWITYAETLYDDPLILRYEELNSKVHYKIRITYAGEDYSLPIRLVANHTLEIHSPLPRDTNPKIVEFPIPKEATSTGTLDLEWTRPPGLGGSGRGHQVAEVWLIPE